MTRKTKSISLALISSSLILAGCTGSSSSGHHRSHVGGRGFIPIPIPIPVGGAGGSAPRGTAPHGATPGVSNLSSSSHIGSGISSSSHSGGFGSSGHSSGS